MSHIVTPTGEIKMTKPDFTVDGKNFYVDHYENHLFAFDDENINYVFDWYGFLDFWMKETDDRMNGYSHKNEEFYLEVKKNVSKEILRECMVTFCQSEFEKGNYKIQID